MTFRVNETHDPSRTSWVESANQAATDFPIQNLPFGVFRRRATNEPPRIGVAIGTQILDLAACSNQGLLQVAVADDLGHVSCGFSAQQLSGLEGVQFSQGVSRCAAHRHCLLAKHQASLLTPGDGELMAQAEQ